MREILRGGADVARPRARRSSAGTRSRPPSRSTASPSRGSCIPRIWRNAGARVGDVLVLTKALGTGIVANALRKGAVDDDVLAAAIASMTTLNPQPRPPCATSARMRSRT